MHLAVARLDVVLTEVLIRALQVALPVQSGDHTPSKSDLVREFRRGCFGALKHLAWIGPIIRDLDALSVQNLPQCRLGGSRQPCRHQWFRVLEPRLIHQQLHREVQELWCREPRGRRFEVSNGSVYLSAFDENMPILPGMNHRVPLVGLNRRERLVEIALRDGSHRREQSSCARLALQTCIRREFLGAAKRRQTMARRRQFDFSFRQTQSTSHEVDSAGFVIVPREPCLDDDAVEFAQTRSVKFPKLLETLQYSERSSKIRNDFGMACLMLGGRSRWEPALPERRLRSDHRADACRPSLPRRLGLRDHSTL